jgi:tetratricopeptide (TPR) repeat protein
MVLGAVNLFHLWELNTAEAELKRAVALNPSSSRAHSYLARLYTVREQPESALEELKTAISCDPLSPILHAENIRTLTSLQKYDEAIQYAYKHMDQMDPIRANLLLGDAFLGKKAIEEALLAYRRCQDLGSNDVVARIATALAVDGMRREGSILLENLLSSSPTAVDPDFIAAAYAQLGNQAKAMDWLRASYQLRSADLILLNVDPNFASLRAYPEFQKLLRLVGI